MVMGETAITILTAMCELGCNSITPADADQMDVGYPLSRLAGFSTDITEGLDLSLRVDTESSVDRSAQSAAVAASAALTPSSTSSLLSVSTDSPSWSVDGAEAFTPADSMEAAHMAARALAQIAEDDWCREPLVQVCRDR